MPSSTASQNMRAIRHFVRDDELAACFFSYIPAHVRKRLGLHGCCTDLRWIRYPLGGYIAPHRDGVRRDPLTGLETHVSFLLYLTTVPDGEGGETTFLDHLPEECADGEQPHVVHSVRPVAGRLLLFPHAQPHQGEAVGSFGKSLLRGDLY